MIRRKHARIVFAACLAVTALTVAVVLVRKAVIPSAVERLHGNAPIRFYGRIVDASGAPISGAEVKFQILYSDKPAVPLPFGREEKIRFATVKTDASGNFELLSQSGYSFSIVSMRSGRRELEYVGPPSRALFKLDDAPPTFRVADSPTTRLVYRMKVPRGN